MDNRPIGVFDSGVGGLTVLENLVEVLPNEDFIYVADQGHCPYGTKEEEDLKECIRNVARYLLSRNVKCIVIGCNTASLYIDEIRKMTTIPVISVIDPTCRYASLITKNKRIAVLGTNTTIKKGKYQSLLAENGIYSVGVPCSEFVDFIENCSLDDVKGDIIVANKLSFLKNENIDTLIYGCTHFSIIERQIKKVLGDKIKYVACGAPTSVVVVDTLTKNNSLSEKEIVGNIELYTTGDVKTAISTIKWSKFATHQIKHVTL
jgi:glutamate racemase